MVSHPPDLRYFGGKHPLGSEVRNRREPPRLRPPHRDAHHIIAQFPHHEFYCEVYGGGASVLLQKQLATFEVYNDLSGDVVNFFKMLRDRPDELIRAVELTPYSKTAR